MDTSGKFSPFTLKPNDVVWLFKTVDTRLR